MEKILEDIKNNNQIIKKIVLSETKSEIKKIIVRPIIIKNNNLWQVEKFIGDKVFHENLKLEDLLNLDFFNYKQILIEKIGQSSIYSKNNNSYKCKNNTNNIKEISKSHNQNKNYILNEGDDIPAFVELGIFTKEGKIVKTMYDKFKQINRFIEIIDDSFKLYNKKDITILDFGCGKSYLTFIIYYYFTKKLGINAKIIGYDIKADVVENCNKIAKKYNYDGLSFVVNDVKNQDLFNKNIDMIITLHACDVATDYALNFAIKNKVKNIFSVPCCQHEINSTINLGGDFDLLLQDGLIKERFSALLTDSIRVNILRDYGYDTDIIEFVDFEQTPKNLMIRAELKNVTKNDKNIKKINDLKQKYKFNQKLLELISF